MDQIIGTTSADPPTQDDSRPPDAGTSSEQPAPPPEGPVAEEPGFRTRGRMRRRARFLRRARELAYRDLGGLVFNLHRFGQRNDALVMAKLSTLGHIDAELRSLETALREREGVTVLREAGITACARCAAIHSSEDRFCPNCGLSMGPHADLPIAGAAAPTGAQSAQPQASTPPRAAGAAGAPGPQTAAETPAATAQTSPPPATAATPPAGARSDTPASDAPAARSSDEDEPTEIIRPPSAR